MACHAAWSASGCATSTCLSVSGVPILDHGRRRGPTNTIQSNQLDSHLHLHQLLSRLLPSDVGSSHPVANPLSLCVPYSTAMALSFQGSQLLELHVKCHLSTPIERGLQMCR